MKRVVVRGIENGGEREIIKPAFAMPILVTTSITSEIKKPMIA